MSALLKGHAVAVAGGVRVASCVLAAREEARQRLEVAKEQARATVEEARQDADRLRAEAAALGREEGLAQAAEVVARAAAERDRLLATAEPELVELAFQIVRRVLADAAERGAVTLVAARALEAARLREHVIVRVHPGDVAALQDARADLARRLVRARGFALREDPSVARGGIVVETEAGRIDGRLESQLAALHRALLPDEATACREPLAAVGAAEAPW